MTEHLASGQLQMADHPHQTDHQTQLPEAAADRVADDEVGRRLIGELPQRRIYGDDNFRQIATHGENQNPDKKIRDPMMPGHRDRIVENDLGTPGNRSEAQQQQRQLRGKDHRWRLRV